tara:strand:- start:432 stop:695 length:264 start_codon:yes stop_codon:yes gene_type:complete
MNKTIQHELYAEVLQTLIEHLRNRNDVQNIDLMNLSGFCRNCLSKWYVKAAEKRNIAVNYEEAEKLFTVCHILNGRQNTKQKQQKNN